jgi:hypothetical protein
MNLDHGRGKDATQSIEHDFTKCCIYGHLIHVIVCNRAGSPVCLWPVNLQGVPFCRMQARHARSRVPAGGRKSEQDHLNPLIPPKLIFGSVCMMMPANGMRVT